MHAPNRKKLIAASRNNKDYRFLVTNCYEYAYQNKKLRVELIEESDGFTILSCNGVRYPVDIISRRQNQYEVSVNGVSYSYSVETPFSMNRKKLLATLNASRSVELVDAPMPGKIVEVFVSPQQEVKPGETLLVLEAMKMQNSIVSPASGIVTKVNVIKGAGVSKGTTLVEIKASH